MKKFAFLCGSAPEGFLQKKLSHKHETLISESWSEREIADFPNGVSEILLEFALNNAISQKSAKILLYICASSSVSENGSILLGDEEIRRDVIAHYEDFAQSASIDFETVFDSDAEFVREEELGYEELSEDERQEFIAKVKSGSIRIGG